VGRAENHPGMAQGNLSGLVRGTQGLPRRAIIEFAGPGGGATGPGQIQAPGSPLRAAGGRRWRPSRGGDLPLPPGKLGDGGLGRLTFRAGGRIPIKHPSVGPGGIRWKVCSRAAHGGPARGGGRVLRRERSRRQRGGGKGGFLYFFLAPGRWNVDSQTGGIMCLKKGGAFRPSVQEPKGSVQSKFAAQKAVRAAAGVRHPAGARSGGDGEGAPRDRGI